MQMDQIFRPLTSSPFRRDDTYTEILPCEALRPYICCFWGTSQPLQRCEAACESLVTPDTCMDILIDLDYTRQSLSSRFVAIDDRAFLARGNGTGHLVATFAVRFYAWAVPLFSDESMVQVQNGFFNADRFFSGFDTAIGGNAALRRFAGGARPFCAAVSFGNSAGAAEKTCCDERYSFDSETGRASRSL